MRLNRLAKSAVSALMGIALWMTAAPPVEAAGTTPLALAIQRDSEGNEVPGCRLEFYVAGTVASPQNAYSDFGLTSSMGPVIFCDQAGRVPMHWLADGLIHVRLTTSAGTPIVDTTLQVLGPSSGGGGGGSTVDPTTILQTGDEKTRYGVGAVAGFVRENGLTIGNGTSGATERANSDTQALFVYLYNTDANLAVSGGRTGNALNDFNAGKQLTLPDMRGRVNGYLADMGNSASTVLSASYCASPTLLGFACGNQSQTLLAANIPPITSTNPSQPITVSTLQHIPVSPTNYANAALFNNPGGVNLPFSASSSGDLQSLSGNNSISVTSTGTSSTPFGVLPPMLLKTIYIKL